MSRKPRPKTPEPPWSHPVRVAGLDPDDPARLSLEPDEDERSRIAAFLGLEALGKLELDAVISPIAGGWGVEGTLRAEVVQSCVVTLAPVPDSIEAAVSRRYLRDLPSAGSADEVELGADDLDAPEPLGDTIDLGLLALETLALALDPWPRAEGAELEDRHFAAPGVTPMTDEEARPFAGLRVLKGGRDAGGEGGGS